MASLQMWLAKSTFSGLRAEFYSDLAEALQDRAPLTDEINKHATRAKKEGDILAPMFRLWYNRMDDRPFSHAIIGTVPDSDVMIIDAAESSSKLPDGLMFLSQVVTASKTMTSALRKAVTGFVFLTLLLSAFLGLFSFYGVPIIEELVPPKDWPDIGKALRAVALFVTGYWAWILAVIGGAGSLYVWALPNWCNKYRVIVDRYIPFFSVYRDFQGAIFLVSMAALMKNGVSLTEALDKLHKRGSYWLRWHIKKILTRLDYEDEPAKAFDTGVFNKRLTWRIIDFGSRSGGDFSVAMEKVGLKTLDRVTSGVINSANTINQVLMLVNAAMLAFIIAGTMLTMYEAQNSLQRQIHPVNVR